MKRIYIKLVEIGNQKLNQETLTYLSKTLRYKGGEKIIVFDSKNEGIAIFKNPDIEIIEFSRTKNEKDLFIAIAEIKKNRLEWILEKACELGVTKIFLLRTERSQPYINKHRLEKILISASMQSGRIGVPLLHEIKLIEFLNHLIKEEWIYCSLTQKTQEFQVKKKGVIIGPEGGWTDKEELLLNSKIEPLHINTNTILRSETAAIAALSYIIFNS